MTTRITEALGSAERTGPGRALLTIITPGQGSSGSYSTEMLQQAAKDRVFPRGTQSHINHTTAVEDMERPEGDLRNLAGVLLEDARWNGNALVAEARIGTAWRDFVDDFGEFIGVSINSAAEVQENGTISRLIPDPFNRVDMVTVAGRGGEITEVLEAARVIESRVAETTQGDKNGWLASAVRSTHGSIDRYVWFEDFDDTYVYFSAEDRERDTFPTWRQEYTITGSTATLTGEPVEVHRRTEYDPITTEAPAVGVDNNREDTDMVDINETELSQLREKADRTDQLTDENNELRNTIAEDARENRRNQALAAVREAFGADAPVFYTRAAETASVDEQYDHEAFAEMVAEAAASHESQAGAGNPTGVGETRATETNTTVSDDDIITALEGR